jgi:hypothetical protein
LTLSKVDPHANKWHTEWTTNLVKVQNLIRNIFGMVNI